MLLSFQNSHNWQKIEKFWPKRGGPHWDSIAITQQNKIILVEAKAHRSEVKSNTKVKSEKSIALIKESLKATKKWLGITCNEDWRKCYYQMSNRLTHLHFLKKVCDLDVYLVYVYFLGDTHFSDKVDTVEKWKEIIKNEKNYPSGK